MRRRGACDRGGEGRDRETLRATRYGFRLATSILVKGLRLLNIFFLNLKCLNYIKAATELGQEKVESAKLRAQLGEAMAATAASAELSALLQSEKAENAKLRTELSNVQTPATRAVKVRCAFFVLENAL